MINKIFFPREVLPISTVISQLINMLLSLVVVFAVLIVARKPLSIKALLVLPIIIFVEAILALGIVFGFSYFSFFSGFNADPWYINDVVAVFDACNV